MFGYFPIMFSQHKLKNGLRVVLSPNKSTLAVSLLVLVKVGSRHEKAGVSGISHFLEHLMFKGTKRRPNTQIISQELDALGAEYNAFTSKDHTGYYIKAEYAHLPLIADILADMLIESIFAPEEIARERGTILEEINMYEDNPMAQVGNFFEADLFGKEAPLGRFIIGTPPHIKAISRAQIVKHWQDNYTAANMVVALAGNFSSAKALKLLQAKFGSLESGTVNPTPRSPEATGRPSLAAHFKATKAAHLVLGFPGLNYTHPDRYTLTLLAVILGGNMSSRLFINVRERLGLCYFIRASADLYEDAGTFAVQAGLDLKQLDKALSAISREIKDIKTKGPKADELKKAKQYLAGKMALGMEESMEVASFYAQQNMFQPKLITPAEALARVQKVTVKDITLLARKILSRRQAYLTALAPFKDVRRFAKNIAF